jgi:hypothetical protein
VEDSSPPRARKVGVYERPPDADRASKVRKIVLVVAVIVAVVIVAALLAR